MSKNSIRTKLEECDNNMTHSSIYLVKLITYNAFKEK